MWVSKNKFMPNKAAEISSAFLLEIAFFAPFPLKCIQKTRSLFI